MYLPVIIILLIAILAIGITCWRLKKRVRSLVQRHSALVRAIQHPLYVIDRYGSVVRVLNSAEFPLFGDVLCDGSFNIERMFVSPGDVERRRKLIAHCIDNATNGSMETVVNTLDGKEMVLNLKISSNYGGNAIETAVDITSSKRETAKNDVRYRAAIKQLQLMLTCSGAMPWVMGPKEECEVIGSNRSGLPDEFQASDDEQIHLQDNDFAAIDAEFRDDVRNKINDVFAGRLHKAMVEYKGRILKNQQESIWFRTFCTPLTVDGDGKVVSVVGATIIIDKEKREAIAMEHAKTVAESNDRMKSMFLSSMCHEVRTPLNVILGFSRLLPSASPEEADEYLHIIDSNGELLLNLMSDVLDMSRIEAGEFNIVHEPMEINSVADLAVSSLQSKNREGVTLSFCRTLPDTIIVADNKRIMQVIMQLVGNALKYTYSGSVTVRVECADVRFVKVMVQDTGEGISPENVEKVFQRFYRANTLELGTGLGLSICQALVHQMGGEIGVESQPGVGSTFWFTVPVE